MCHRAGGQALGCSAFRRHAEHLELPVALDNFLHEAGPGARLAIHHEQVRIQRGGFQHGRGFDGVGRLRHPVAVDRENAADHFAQDEVGFDEQHGLGATCDRQRGQGGRHRLLGLRGFRQENFQRRAGTGQALHGDVPVVLRHDVLHHRETEAGARGLGGEERLEHSPARCVVHAVSGIGHLQRRITPRTHFQVGAILGFSRAVVERAQRELAAVGHGVTRVDREIQDGVFKLSRIGIHRPNARRQHSFNLDGLANGALDEIGHAAYHGVGDQRLRVEGGLP